MSKTCFYMIVLLYIIIILFIVFVYMKIIIRSVIILFSMFLVGSVSYAKEIQSCNVKRKQAPIVNISNAKKTCTTVSKKWIIPDGLWGVDNMYLISDEWKLYALSYGDTEEKDSCKYGGDGSWSWYRFYIDNNTPFENIYKKIRLRKDKNYLTYYGWTMYSWLMVFEYLWEEKTQEWIRTKYGYQEYSHMSSEQIDNNYAEGYLYDYWEFPVFVVADIIYNPRDKKLWTKYVNHEITISEDAMKNYFIGIIKKKNLNTYRWPRLFQWKNPEWKIIVARQENIQILYDKNGVINKTKDRLSMVTYDLTTCTLN